MRALLAALLLFGAPAQAQQVPNPQPRNTVANNAALLASSAGAYPQGVWRLDFAPARPAPPQFYRPSTTACPLNGGNGDDGAEVRSSDGKCWLAQFTAEGADLRQWGVAFDGVTDSAAAFSAAVSWAAADGATLRLPPGSGRALTSGAVATIPDGRTLKIVGAGPDSSVIQVNGAYGLDLTYGGRASSVSLEAFGLCDARQNAGTTGIRLSTSGISRPADSAINKLEDIAIRGCSGYAGTQGFTTGVDLNQVSNVNFNRVLIHGPFTGVFPLAGVTGVRVTGDPVNVSVSYNFSGVNLSYLDAAIVAGPYTQGLTVAQSNFVINNHGVSVPSITGTAQVVISGSAFECVVTCISGAASMTNIYGNLLIMDVGNGIGIHFTAMNDALILNNQIVQYGSQTGLIGIKVDGLGGGGATSSIRGNSFIALESGINLAGAGAYNIRVNENSYSVTNPLVFGPGAQILEVSDTYVPFSNIAPCGFSGLNARAQVLDSNTATWGATIAGGGANLVGGICNGANFTVYAK